MQCVIFLLKFPPLIMHFLSAAEKWIKLQCQQRAWKTVEFVYGMSIKLKNSIKIIIFTERILRFIFEWVTFYDSIDTIKHSLERF